MPRQHPYACTDSRRLRRALPRCRAAPQPLVPRRRSGRSCSRRQQHPDALLLATSRKKTNDMRVSATACTRAHHLARPKRRRAVFVGPPLLAGEEGKNDGAQDGAALARDGAASMVARHGARRWGRGAMAAQRRVAMALAQSPHTERLSWGGPSLVAAADTRSWSGAARELEERERRPPWWDASTSAEGVERRAGLGADGRWAAWQSAGELWPIQVRDDDAAPTHESGRPL